MINSPSDSKYCQCIQGDEHFLPLNIRLEIESVFFRDKMSTLQYGLVIITVFSLAFGQLHLLARSFPIGD